jgi:hypothetical protein
MKTFSIFALEVVLHLSIQSLNEHSIFKWQLNPNFAIILYEKRIYYHKRKKKLLLSIVYKIL